MQKTYELMVLLHPDLEIDVETPISKIEGLIQAVGGKVTRRDNWGKKRLAYRIKRQDFAIYVYFELLLAMDKVSELERALLITDEVVRHILVVHNENESKSRRDDKMADKKDEVAEAESEPEAAKEEGDK